MDACILPSTCYSRPQVLPEGGNPILSLLQAALQQHMQSIQEENVSLKRTVAQTPSDLNKLHRQISK